MVVVLVVVTVKVMQRGIMVLVLVGSKGDCSSCGGDDCDGKYCICL